MYERSAGSPARGWVRQEKLIPVTVMTPQGPMHQFREHYLNRQIQEKPNEEELIKSNGHITNPNITTPVEESVKEIELPSAAD